VRRQYGIAGGGEVKVHFYLGAKGPAQTSDQRTELFGRPLGILTFKPWSHVTTIVVKECVKRNNHRLVLLGNNIVQDCLGRRVLWDVGNESFFILLGARISDKQAAARQHSKCSTCRLAVNQEVLKM
jgi:hypothetical protein